MPTAFPMIISSIALTLSMVEKRPEHRASITIKTAKGDLCAQGVAHVLRPSLVVPASP